MIEFKTATKNDLCVLEENLRDDDRIELSVCNCSELEMLEYCYNLSDECYSMFHNNILVAVFGAMKIEGGGSLWMFSTKQAEHCKKSFYKYSLQYFQIFERKYGYLECLTHSKYERAIEWLQRCGFEGKDSKWINGELFYLMANGGDLNGIS